MSAHITFKCTQDCGIRIPLEQNMPVFKEGTPSDLMILPVRKQSLPYLEGYESDYFCLICKQVVTIFNYRSSQEMKYRLNLEKWNNRSLILKAKQYLKGVKPPVLDILPNTWIECPCCGQSVFLEENEPCYNCEEGVFIIDESATILY